MSQQPIGHSTDLKRLRDEGYDIEIRAGHLVVKQVPYVNTRREVKRGELVCKLTLAGDVTTPPDTHVALFAGDYPCDKDGNELTPIKHQSTRQDLGQGLIIDHSFSSKPVGNGKYADYYEKMTTYVAIISNPARAIDPNVTAKVFPVIQSESGESVFEYVDTASSRAETSAVTEKLALGRVGIVGLGGTGAYVLDLVAKTPVRQICLFDGDTFLQHNAFRSPGAPSVEELQKKVLKVEYFKTVYGKMHRNIITYGFYLDESNFDHLQGMDFVFLCLDRSELKKVIVERLEASAVPFIDVGMGVELVDGSLGGVLRVTTSSREKRDHVRTKNRIPFSDGDGNNEYSRNIQIADLNALNAALAVIKWKKLFGFYRDFDKEHHSTYTVDGNALVNEDKPCDAG